MSLRRFRVQMLVLAGWLLAGALLGGLIQVRAAHASSAESARPELSRVIVLYRAEGAEIALPQFRQLLNEYRAAADRGAQAEAARYVGECHWRLGQLDQSREFLDEALALSRAVGDRPLEGRVKNVLGLLGWDLGNYETALADFSEAHGIASTLGDRRLEASTLNNRGLVRDELGDYRKSLEDYQSALVIFSDENDLRGQGDALGNIGGVHLLLGRYGPALEHYQRALAISEELQSKPGMTIDHGNIALGLLGQGRIDQALRHFDRALELADETGMDQELAYWQRSKANALISQGKYDLGLEYHRKALAAYELSGARSLLLDAQHDMGLLMLTLGDPVSAESWFQQAMQLARDMGLQRAVTKNLLALGDLQFRRERPTEARALYALALERARDSGEVALQALGLLRLARVERAQGQQQAASTLAASALEISRDTGAQPLEAEAWFALGEAARLQNNGALADPEQALQAYAMAEQAAGAGSDPNLLWRLQHGRALALEQAGQTDAAVASLEEAVQVIESVRQRLREERFRAGWVEDKYQVYFDLVRLQLELGRTREAFSTAERLRARSFLAQMDRSPLPPSPSTDAAHEASLRERIRLLQKALDEEQLSVDPAPRRMAIDTFSTELMQAERDYQAFLDDQGSETVRRRIVSVPALSAVQSRLDAEDALLEYVVGEQGLMIFVVRSDGITALTGAPGRQALTAQINLVRELVQSPGEQSWEKPTAALSASLFAPVRKQGLLKGVRHITVVPHGILNYLPFALLPIESDGSRVLVEEFTLSYLPAAAALLEQGRSGGSKHTLLALAPANARLQFAPREARSVAAMFGPTARLLLGKQATESAFKSQAGEFQVLHFATHGVFNKQNPLLSGLKLEADSANDGLLEVHEILGLSLRADLVTMSACETGLGSGWFSDIPAGDDFVGLTRAFLVAGSNTVLASLWEVDDRSTVELMEGFYQRLGTPGANTGQALALAGIQREMRASKEFNHPFYWAPFMLVGPHGTAASRG